MKLLFVPIAMAALGLAGASLGHAYRQRARLLAQLVREISRLKEQIRLGYPLAAAMRQTRQPLLQEIEKNIAPQGIYAAWQQAASAERFAVLEESERQVLDRFWRELGLLDKHSQINRFEEALSSLKTLRDEATQKAAQQSRLYGALGILAGLSVGILLW